MKLLQRFSFWTSKGHITAELPNGPARFGPVNYISLGPLLVLESHFSAAVDAHVLETSYCTLGEFEV
jgi:hypothetical protein